MKTMTLLKGLGEIDDKYIESAAPSGYLGNKSKIVRFNPRRWIAAASAAAAVFAISLIAINNPFSNTSEPRVETGSPIVECASIEEAVKLTGIKMSAPDEYKGSTSREITVIDNKIIDISYYDESSNRLLTIRKGVLQEDISGDYNVYKAKDTIIQDGITITVKGNNGNYNVAEWQDNEYAYSISSDDGLTRDELLSLYNSVMQL